MRFAKPGLKKKRRKGDKMLDFLLAEVTISMPLIVWVSCFSGVVWFTTILIKMLS